MISMNPTEINLIVYKKRIIQEVTSHGDGYSMLRIFLVILQDSYVGPLHVEVAVIPEKLKQSDRIFLDPSGACKTW